MKKFPLISILLVFSIVFNACNKDITAPEQSADGSDVVYLKIDDKEEFLLESKNKRLHKKTAGKFDDYDNSIVKYSESTVNNRELAFFDINIEPFNSDKAAFKRASIWLQFDKNTLELDTAFLRKYLSITKGSFINFTTEKEEYKEYYIDSILDYKIVKWDPNNKTFTFWANCTYSHSPKATPSNPRIYFYFDLKYNL
jgi:hypothetical protein